MRKSLSGNLPKMNIGMFLGIPANKLINDSEKYRLIKNLVGDFRYIDAISTWFNNRPEISLKEKLELTKAFVGKDHEIDGLEFFEELFFNAKESEWGEILK